LARQLTTIAQGTILENKNYYRITMIEKKRKRITWQPLKKKRKRPIKKYFQGLRLASRPGNLGAAARV